VTGRQFGAPRVMRFSVPQMGHSIPTLKSGDFTVFSLRRIGSISTRKRRFPHLHRISSVLLPLLPGLSFAMVRLIFEDTIPASTASSSFVASLDAVVSSLRP
jgi:hypothetical protein